MFDFFGRLHREALKQSAIDPLSGKIDVSILTTGISAAARARRNELTGTLKKLFESKGKIQMLNYQKVFTELKEMMQIVSNHYISFLNFQLCFIYVTVEITFFF